MPKQLKCECGTCSVCKSRERMRAARQDNPEHVRALDRARYARDREKRLAAMRAYAQTPAGKAAHTRADNAWKERNPAVRAASVAAANLIRLP